LDPSTKANSDPAGERSEANSCQNHTYRESTSRRGERGLLGEEKKTRFQGGGADKDYHYKIMWERPWVEAGEKPGEGTKRTLRKVKEYWQRIGGVYGWSTGPLFREDQPYNRKHDGDTKDFESSRGMASWWFSRAQSKGDRGKKRGESSL